MKKFISRVVAFAMAAVIMFSVSPAITAEAKKVSLGSETFYLKSKKSGATTCYFSVEGITSVKKVTSSNPKVARIYNYDVRKNSSYYEYWYDRYGEGFEKTSTNSSSNKYVSCNATVFKSGTATLSLTSGKNTYSKKFKILDYTNPLKTLTVSNVNNGKNIAGKLKNGNEAKVKGKKAKTINVAAEVKPGWGIKSIYISNTAYDSSVGHSLGAYTYRYFNNAKTAKHAMQNYSNKRSASVSVDCYNKKTKASLTVYARINQ